ncbi:long-chain-fatty-acid--CoA ligase [Actinomadura kijaniata]|uniref:Fatty-acyl-CoA synthase n=1 Tax=Actinomadura namibiensis TaxID=182080 RepID=A0A7W3LJ36_ACTNM|nr:AMP-binding protein [Actinomadura namibiensis]MBA8949102.1 fatty-acyl-CoA synthase [Actinomadura namibiensis]
MTVAALLEARAADAAPGLRCADDGRAWSWREVVAESAARAAWMDARRPDDRPLHVGVLLDNVPDLVFLICGAALSGNVVVALNTSRGPAELAADAERADCDLILTQERHAGLAAKIGSRRVVDIASGEHRDELAAHENTPPPDASAITGQTLMMLIFTSGTSGRPRAVRVTHRKVVVPGENLGARLLKADDVVYCPMPLFHSGALMAAFAPALYAGAELVIRSRFSASGLLPDVRRYGCTYLHYVGKALSYVVATPPGGDDADNPLKVAFGNEAAPLEQKAFAERFGCLVIDAYGSTETAIHLSPDPLGPPGALGRLPEGIAILDPATGRECPPARFDAAGRLLNGDEAIGELVNTRDMGVFDGYYKEDAPDRIRDGMYWSGDLAYADGDGHVFFAGRISDRLRVDGENFGAAQVERALAGFADASPGVRGLAVYGVPDAASGDQVMVAFAADGFDPDAFAAYLRDRADLGPKWPPRYVRVMPDLPATPSNKILKRPLAREGWRTGDPVWWRPGRDLAYRRLTPQDAARIREEFAVRGRLHLLEGSG